jgi:hypothetical protein
MWFDQFTFGQTNIGEIVKFFTPEALQGSSGLPGVVVTRA